MSMGDTDTEVRCSSLTAKDIKFSQYLYLLADLIVVYFSFINLY